MKLSNNGLDLIKKFEGLRLEAYKAVPTEKYYTIGYGHYGSDVAKDSTITKKYAEDLLKQDVKRFEAGVNDAVRVPLNQNQYDALVSFTYNVGVGALKKSTLLEKLNKKDYEGASKEFARWNKSGGKVLNGLVKRRSEEAQLFLKKPPEPVKQTTKRVEYVTHTIRLGETLGQIADRYKVDQKQLETLNKIADPDIIYAGRKLKIRKK